MGGSGGQDHPVATTAPRTDEGAVFEMPYVQRVQSGPLDGALVVVDTDLPVVAHCLAYRLPDGALTITMTATTEVPAAELSAALRGLADSLERGRR